MTKVILRIEKDNSIMFDCMNHSEDYNVCTIISTLCGVLGVAADRADCEPTIYNDGHCRFDIPKAQDDTIEVFDCVMDAMRQAAHQHPGHIKIY